MTYDASNPEHVKKARREAAITSKQDVDDLRWLLSSRQGRRLAWRILEKGGAFHSCFTGNSATYHNEGRADYARQIMTELCTADRSKFLEMFGEHFPDHAEDELKADLPQEGSDNG